MKIDFFFVVFALISIFSVQNNCFALILELVFWIMEEKGTSTLKEKSWSIMFSAQFGNVYISKLFVSVTEIFFLLII